MVPEIPEPPELPDVPAPPELPDVPAPPELPEPPKFWVVVVSPSELPVVPELPALEALKSPARNQVPFTLTNWAVALDPVNLVQYEAPRQVTVAVAWSPLVVTDARTNFGYADPVCSFMATLQFVRSAGSTNVQNLAQLPACRYATAVDAVD